MSFYTALTHPVYLLQQCTACAHIISVHVLARPSLILPEISKRPHLEVLDLLILFLLRQHPILARPTPSPRGRCVRLGLGRYRRMVSYFVTVDFFLMLSRTRRTRPSISAAWLREQRGRDTAHMEEVLASVTLDGFRTVRRNAAKGVQIKKKEVQRGEGGRKLSGERGKPGYLRWAPFLAGCT